MKFCKHLKEAIDFSNPEWAPFWTNYKLLKKLIKNLPFVISDDTLEIRIDNSIGKNINEVKFFKQVHAELEKVSSFFTKARKEMKIRYDRVHDGSRIFNNSESIMTVQDRWALLGRSVSKLHNNLLLLETFAIMNYCAFSKILKKHDKKTGYRTKMAFMQNVVNKSSIATYPDVLDMIQRCETLYDQASKNIGCKEKLNLREDEQLFISMVRKLHTQDLATADDVALDKRSYARMLPTEISPIRTEVTGIETLLDDLLKANEKLGGTVCEGSIVSEASLLEDVNGSKYDEFSTSDTESRFRKHRFFPPDFCQRLKKQRCHQC